LRTGLPAIANWNTFGVFVSGFDQEDAGFRIWFRVGRAIKKNDVLKLLAGIEKRPDPRTLCCAFGKRLGEVDLRFDRICRAAFVDANYFSGSTGKLPRPSVSVI
jgi:hypothetical protein